MTVEELIKALQNLPDDLQKVSVDTSEGCVQMLECCHDITGKVYSILLRQEFSDD